MSVWFPNLKDFADSSQLREISNGVKKTARGGLENFSDEENRRLPLGRQSITGLLVFNASFGTLNRPQGKKRRASSPITALEVNLQDKNGSYIPEPVPKDCSNLQGCHSLIISILDDTN